MQLSGEYTFDAPQALVWNALQDPEILGSVMPGGKGFQEVAPNEFTGVLSVKVGPVNGTFNGKIQLSDVVPPESYTIQVEGNGAQGHVTGGGSLKLTPQGEQTHIRYQGDAQVGGRIASVGQRLIDASAKSIIRQSLEGLNAYLKIEAQKQALTEANGETDGGTASAEDAASIHKSQAADSPAATYTPPSQTTVALNVASDVARDLIPPSMRPVLLLGGLALGALLLWRLLS